MPKKTIKALEIEMKEQVEATDDRLSVVEETMTEMAIDIKSSFAEVLKEMNNMSFKNLAKNNPNIITKDGVSSEDVYQHDDEYGIEFQKNPDAMADVEVVRHGLKSVHNSEFKEKADQLRFDDEQIEIMVMASQSTYPDHTFTIGVNGRLKLIVRGTKQWMERKYVEVLLRAKVSTYGNFERRNEYNGELEVINPETKSHRYPLQVITDRNPKGAAWLMRVTNDTAA